MAKFGCPAIFIAMVRQFHDGMLARVQNDGEFSDHFPVTNGVKLGCVLTSTLFRMMFSSLFTMLFRMMSMVYILGIALTGSFSTKEGCKQTEVLDEFLFANDMTKGVQTEKNMQKDVDQVSDSCDIYYLTISIKKLR